jgi:ubiquinone/menaquinone biosynthesis C-methylase UbiE
MFNYEKKIYSKKPNFNIPFLNGGVIGLIPTEFKNLPQNCNVLDVGCGGGYYTGEILRKRFPNFNISAVDISRQAIKQAKINYPTVKFRVASAYRLPFPNRHFEVVILNCTLEHLGHPEKALSEVRRVLKKGGVFFSITPIEGQRGVYWQDAKLSKKYHGHLQRFDSKSLQFVISNTRPLAAEQFKIKRSYYTGFWFCQLMSGLYMRYYKNRNKNPDYQIPNKFNLVKFAINLMINLESLIFGHTKLPGLYMHVISLPRQ